MPTPQLLDHLGRPVSTAALKGVEATAQVSGVRSVWQGTAANGLTPQRLAGILRAAENRDIQAYLELAEQMEERDLHYLAVLGTRKRAISQLPMRVEAAGDDAAGQKHADFIDDWLQRDALRMELFDILDAIGKGFSVSELVWATSEGQWVVDRLQLVDPRWFDLDQVDGRTLSLRGEAEIGRPLTPFKYLVHEHGAKSGLPIRGGLARPVSWAWMFKTYGLKDWVAFAEVYGLPMRVGKYGPGATPAEIATLMGAVADMGGDAAAVIPQSMVIEFVAGAGQASPDMFEKLHDKMDQQISKGVLGQTTTTDAISGGHAVGKEHNDVRGDIERSDALQLAAALNVQLVRPMIDLNFGPQKRYPKIVIGREEAIDLQVLFTGLQAMIPFGLEVEESVIRDKLGLPEPVKGAKLLTPQKPAQEPPGPGGALPSPANDARPPSKASQGLSGGKGKPTDAPADEAAAAAAQIATPATPDPIDRLADDLAGDGDWFVAPLAAAALALLDDAGDLATFRERLAELADAPAAGGAVQAAADRLGRGNFNAFLAGAAGQRLNPSEDDA
ncbi:DUF935 family protein [Caulobacter sp. SLTY]|uniref:DUF935 domain-containing protein n=1 Tax=Caulobacter sp. SLTY TaxID=2683262 RepID=UPI00141339CA|nr:DUF935 domain-containing protein [Caulobacter sp. SLTY]NBB17035.1 DUF935 family protein [Caulobacter sp. SLTY]